jgi:hypothetical protein
MIFYPFILSYCTEKDSLFYLFFQLQLVIGLYELLGNPTT